MINKMNRIDKKQLELEKAERVLGKNLTAKEKSDIRKAVEMTFDQYGETLIRLGRT